jgi:hypothetical protein
MPSTFTTSLKIELIGNGEQSTTWGLTTNNNMGTLIEQSIAGVQPITLTGDTVLTNFNGISDQARNAVLVFNGSLANAANVVAPSVEKTYIVSNRSGANVTIKTSSGVGVTLANSTNKLIYCDGAEFYTAINPNDITGDLSVSGNQTITGGLTAAGNATIKTKITSNTGTLTLNSNTGIVDMATNSGAFTPPTGATSDRPGSPDLGMTRWNTTLGVLEIWSGTQWQNITGNYAVDYLIVAGGGGGSGVGSGGGGAGGFLSNSTTVTVGTAYSITIGAGGAGSVSDVMSNGANSSAFSMVSIGGGAGGANGGAGASGGSGGGGGSFFGGAGGAGTAGQGNAGGAGNGGNNNFGGGGGGGAGQAGVNGTSNGGGNGGNGLQSAITGVNTYYAGGGGGANDVGLTPSTGGLGGGAPQGGSQNAVANTGGGGAGYAGSGGSGVVIVRYASASQRGNGGTVTSYSDLGVTYFVHTFTSSGTYTA